jgi:hypothetical protein
VNTARPPPSQRPLRGDRRLEHRGPSPSDSCCARIRSYMSTCQLPSIRAEPAVNAARPHPASGLCAAIAGWSQAYGIWFTSGVTRGVVTSASMSLCCAISIGRSTALPPVWSGPCVTGVQREPSARRLPDGLTDLQSGSGAALFKPPCAMLRQHMCSTIDLPPIDQERGLHHVRCC